MAPVPKSYVNAGGASRGLISKKEENKGPGARSNSKMMVAGQINNRAQKPAYNARGLGNLNRNPPIINESGAARQAQRNIGLPKNVPSRPKPSAMP